MPASLLDSQLDVLEPPEPEELALEFDASDDIAVTVGAAERFFRATST